MSVHELSIRCACLCEQHRVPHKCLFCASPRSVQDLKELGKKAAKNDIKGEVLSKFEAENKEYREVHASAAWSSWLSSATWCRH